MRSGLWFLVALVLMFSVAVDPFRAFAAAEDDVKSAIAAAEDRIVVCYGAVADADRAGANVTGLLVVLDESGWLLSRANLAYEMGNSTRARNLAILSQERLNGFVAQAEALREDALEQGHLDFMVNVVGSIVGTGVVVFGGFVVWFFLKTRYGLARLREYGVLFVAVAGVLALLVASPVLSRILVYPRTDFFTELWILDANHTAEDYPFNVTRNQNYSIYLGIGNHLDYCAYYLIQAKFRNQTQEAPTSFGPVENRSPSSLPSLFNVTVFVADEAVWELPLTFSFDYVWNEGLSKVDFLGLRFNDVWLNMTDYTVSWDSDKREFRGFLFLELWLYNVSSNVFEYHGRFVDLQLNMTAS